MLPGLMKDLAKFFAMLLLLLPVNSFSLGLGEINLHSALNQSLDAEIGLLSVGNTDAEEINVKLASRDDFEKAGLERPFFLTKFKFQVLKRTNGEPYLKITSHEPVKEPFLDFIIEANWPGGRILREYTLLLDPPVLVDERPSALDIPLFEDEAASNGGGEVSRGASSATGSAADVAPARLAPRVARRTSEVSIANNGEITYGPVKTTDTLWRIASQMKPDNSVTVQQVMMALLNENPQAFDQQNINNLKAGYVLRIADPAVISEMTSGEAERIAKLQYEQWVDAKHSTALAAGQRPLGRSGGSSERGMAAAGSQGEVESRLKLVAPAEGMSQAGSGSALDASEGDVRQELAFAMESVDVSRQENEELRKRLAALEEQLASMQRLMTLKGDTLSAMQASPESPVTAEVPENGTEQLPDEVVLEEMEPESMVASNEESQSASATTESSITTPPPVAIPPPPVETSMIDDALAVFDGLMGDSASMLPDVEGMLGGFDPVILLGGVAVIAVVAGGLVMRRRKMAAFEEAMEADDDASYSQTPVSEPEVAAENSDEAVESVLNDVIPEYSNSGGMDVSDDDEIDAIAEADVYLAYRRYDKAEELLSEAVQNEPDRLDVQVKLLEVYAASDKKEAFIERAEKLQASLGDSNSSIWKGVAEMGRKIAPTSLLFNDEVAVDSTGASDELAMDLPDLGGELDLGDLEMDGNNSSAPAVASESDNPFDDVNEDDMGALSESELGDAFNALDDLGELEASLDSAMEMASEGNADALPDLDLTASEDALEGLDASTENSDEITFENEFALDSVADTNKDASSELSFDEDVADNLSSEDNTLDFTENDVALGLDDDATVTDSLETKVDDVENELEFEGLESQPILADDSEDLNDSLILDDSDNASDFDVTEKNTSATEISSDAVTETTATAVEDVEEDLFAGLDNSGTGDSTSDDDWLSDFSADISSLDEEFGDLEDSDLFSAEDEVGTKLDLARAYIDMGDNESAKGILDEVVNDGNDDQKKDANELIERIA